MKFKDLENFTPIRFNGKTFRSWDIVTDKSNPYLTNRFADIDLWCELMVNGEEGNSIDDKIAYYVGLDDDIDESVEEYND